MKPVDRPRGNDPSAGRITIPPSIPPENRMRKALSFAAVSFASVMGLPAAGQSPEMSLTRFECGTPRPAVELNQRFSDTYAYPGMTLQLVFSCYLIKHGADYMVWDTGFGPEAGATTPKVALVEQLAKMGVKPEQVKFVG